MISRRTYALASLVGLMIVWGSTFVVTKAAVGEIPPFTLAALRFLIAALVLVPFAWRFGLTHLPKTFPFVPLIFMGLTGIAVFTIAFNYALVYGSATQGALVYALLPAAVSLAAVMFLHESPSRSRITGIGLSIGGVALVVAAGETDRTSPRPLLGAVCMFGAIASWAAYTVFAKQLARSNQIVVMSCVTVIGMIMLLPLAMIELSGAPWPNPSLKAWLGILFLGIVASGVAFVVYGLILRELNASLVGAYTNLDPIVGVLTAVMFLGEVLHLGQIIGGAIAISGMWIATRNRLKGRHDEKI
jgi:drug/metabolite transporter (DMT)-like permease